MSSGERVVRYTRNDRSSWLTMTSMNTARHPRREASEIAGPSWSARVLEPSPPAIIDDWFADDAVALDANRPTLRPIAGGALTWEDWLRDHPEHREWAADRWLGAYRRIGPMPTALPATRLALHRLAAYVVSPARRRVNGKFGLRWTYGGFGTPFFGADEQVRVERSSIVVQRGEHVQGEAITSLARAAELVLGNKPDVEWASRYPDIPAAGDLDAPLAIEEHAVSWLSDWYGLANSALEELRHDPRSSAPGRVQLWPEHFDVGIELLSPDRRATYGASPGDEAVPYPYLYVSVWNEVAPDELWNATSFRGAIRPAHEVIAAPDQRRFALEFYRSARDRLLASP